MFHHLTSEQSFPILFFAGGGLASKGVVSISNQWVGQWSYINSTQEASHSLFLLNAPRRCL